ncbi:PIR Superfamily Protein, partial [Plasmodium ovale curtisi]
YGIFKTIDYYRRKAHSVALKKEAGKEEEYCNSFLNDSLFTHVPNPKIFCAQFKKLYDLLYNGTRAASSTTSSTASLDDIDRAFLNYWLNDKLRGINIDPSICVNEFYKQIKNKNKEIFKDELLEKKLYNIEKYDLENMRRLYDLYNIKSEVSGTMAHDVSDEKSALCLTYTKDCFGKYRDAIINCLDNCSYFYSFLTDFKNIYKEEFTYYTKISNYCKSEELFDLPDYDTVLKEYISGQFKRIITLPVLFPLLGMFFTLIFSNTLTSFRQKAFEKIKSTKNILLGARERRNELLSYTSDNDNIIGDHEEYSIRYYSVGNY